MAESLVESSWKIISCIGFTDVECSREEAPDLFQPDSIDVDRFDQNPGPFKREYLEERVFDGLQMFQEFDGARIFCGKEDLLK